MHSIRSRLLAGYGAFILLLLLTFASTLWTTQIVQRHFDAAVQVDTLLGNDVHTRLALISEQRIAVKDYLLTTWPQDVAQFRAGSRALAVSQTHTLADARPRPELLPLLAAVTSDEAQWETWAARILASAPLAPSRSWTRSVSARSAALASRIDAADEALLSRVSRQQESDLTLGLSALTATRLLLGTILVAAMVVVGGVGLLTLHAIAPPIAYLAGRAATIGRGEVSGPIAARGAAEFAALGESMEAMRVQLVEEAHRRERYEQRLARYAAIVRSIHEAVVTTDADGTIVGWNPGAERLYGYAAAEAIGQHLAFLEPDHLEGETRLHLRLALEGNDLADVEGERVTKSGARVMVSVTLSPLRAEDGQIIGVTVVARDDGSRKLAEDRLRHGALEDPSTRLPNTALLIDRLDRALISARRNGDSVAVLILAVTGHGNEEPGDEVLPQMASRLVTTLRASDTVARLKGHLFAVVLPESDGQQAEHTAQRLIEALQPLSSPNGTVVARSPSIGIALFPAHGQSPGVLLAHAELAMNAARQTGRSIWVYAPDHDLSSPVHLARIQALRDALVHETLLLHYQPIVDLATGQVVQVEALARWQASGDEFIPPSQFIPLAEQADVIESLDILVVRKALAQNAAWRAAGLELPIGVNLSAASLRNPNLPRLIATLLAGTEARGPLVLEVKESVLAEEGVPSADVLESLRRLGLRVAIDDFGTRYSPPGHLRQLPVDEIKIDRSVIQHLAPSEQDVVRTAIGTARELGLTVTAVGIEDEETLYILRNLDCARGQGYFLARPMPAEALDAWMRAGERQAHDGTRQWQRRLEILDLEVLRRLCSYPSDITWDELFAAFGPDPVLRANVRRGVRRLSDRDRNLVEVNEQRVGLTLAGRLAAERLGAGLPLAGVLSSAERDGDGAEESGSEVAAM